MLTQIHPIPNLFFNIKPPPRRTVAPRLGPICGLGGAGAAAAPPAGAAAGLSSALTTKEAPVACNGIA